jgi:ABC-type glycerol-3-phosphate transport system permease component
MRGLRKYAFKFFWGIFVLFIMGFFLLPLLWLVTAPFDAKATLRVAIPSKFTFANFQAIFRNTFAVRALFLNSIVIAGGTMLGVTVFATLAAYALARLNIRGRDILAYLLVLFFLCSARNCSNGSHFPFTFPSEAHRYLSWGDFRFDWRPFAYRHFSYARFCVRNTQIL